MHPDEEATIRAFMTPSRRARWLEKLACAKHRRGFLDRLNHCSDFDERYATPLPSVANVAEVLRSRGAPMTCRIISDISEIDGVVMPLPEALDRTELEGFGTLLCCEPGRLAYYYDESGARRWLLERNAPRPLIRPIA